MSPQTDQLAASLFFDLVALLLAVLCAFALYESWTVITSRAPVTWFSKLGIAEHPRFAFVVVFALGALFGHLFWT